MPTYQVSAFYKFVALESPESLQHALQTQGTALGILGTILLAGEGINGTVAGPGDKLEQFLAFLRSIKPFNDLEDKQSTAAEPPFLRFKVRLKKEIVPLGEDGVDPANGVGTYVDPEDWNSLISDPETVLIDTRNHYETAIGTFTGAIDPKTQSFRDFSRWVRDTLADSKKKKVAMYCTGGIRCEKATAFLRKEGFEQVYHLKGGILKYLEKVPESASRWQGSCFVFDQRVGLKHGLKESGHSLCHGCRHPLAPEDLEHPDFEAGVACHRCAHDLDPEKRERLRERQRQVLLARERGEAHIGTQPAAT